ncbi:TPA: hypothetical protein ENG04_03040 [Candidatus Poribacteria bacterium]|nr:hypothetical protein [Candidatus Poribacteria bacterium]HEX29038.1 hypothetical protein [Candidatus Poribacteria bacterium]
MYNIFWIISWKAASKMFRIISRRRYRALLSELNDLRRKIRGYETQNQQLLSSNEELLAKVAELEGYREKYEDLSREYEEKLRQFEEEVNREVEERVRELGIDKRKYEQMLADRQELIELYIEKLYSLARKFALENKRIRKNRGLFLILVDERNMDRENFSDFHEGQVEYLDQNLYKGIDNLPHIFSPKIEDVFNFMGERVEIVDESGEVTGHEERDGAVLINLKGIAFKTRVMVEGVRTHKVYNKVEKLLKGNAKHAAAIYASSLDEVMVSIVVSEETSEVTMFRDGKFMRSYDPYADKETLREEILQLLRNDMNGGNNEPPPGEDGST